MTWNVSKAWVLYVQEQDRQQDVWYLCCGEGIHLTQRMSNEMSKEHGDRLTFNGTNGMRARKEAFQWRDWNQLDTLFRLLANSPIRV